MIPGVQGETDWAMVAFIGFVVVTICLSWQSARTRRRSNLAKAEGDYLTSVECLLKARRSSNPLEILERRIHAGKIEAVIALTFQSMGQIEQAAHWISHAARIVRAPAIKKVVVQALHSIRSHPAAVAMLDAELGDASDLMSTTAELDSDSRRILLLQHGRVQDALEMFRDESDANQARESVLGLCGKLIALAAGGYDELVCRTTERLLDSGSLTAIAKAPSAPAGANAQVAADKVARSEHAIRLLAIAEVAMTSALKQQHRPLVQEIRQLLPSLESHHPFVASVQATVEGVVAAFDSNADAVAQAVEQLRSLAQRYPQDLQLARICLEGEARVLAADQRYRDALATMEQLKSFPASRLTLAGEWDTRARFHHALGEHANFNACVDEVRRVAPSAGIAQPEGFTPLDPETTQSVQRWAATVELSANPPIGIQTIPATESCAEVASGLAAAVWILAIPAMFPIFGVFPAFALGTLLTILLVKKAPLPYDRRVGAAGLILTIISVGVTLNAITHIYASTKSNEIDELGWEQRNARWQEEFDRDEAEELAAAESNGETEKEPGSPAMSAYADSKDADATTGLAAETSTDSQPADADSLAEPVPDAAEAEVAPDDRFNRDRFEFPWEQKVLFFLVLIFSIMLHEIGHAVSAYWSGDPTARNLGRFSLNPIRHCDPLGSVLVPLAMFMLPGDSVIGWAKPVPFHPHLLRKPRAGYLGITLAGVSLNLLLAFLAANALILTLCLLRVLHPVSHVFNLEAPFNFAIVITEHGEATPWVWAIAICKTFIFVNILLAGFNLLPFPPLDGFGVLRALAPDAIKRRLAPLSGVGMIVAMVLIFSGLLTKLLLPAILLAVILIVQARFVVFGF